MLKTEIFSKLSRTAPAVLATYAEAEVLLPQEEGCYSEIQLAVADQIGALYGVGFDLDTIKVMQKGKTGVMVFGGDMMLQNPALRVKKVELSRRFRLLNSAQEQFRADGMGMPISVELKEGAPVLVASVRKTLASATEENALWALLAAEGFGLSLGELRRVLFHDTVYHEENTDMEVQRSVTAPFAHTENVVCKELPAETYVSATIQGDYGKLYAGHEAIAHWAAKNGYELDSQGLFYNYKVNAEDTNKPEEYVTEVCCRILK